MKIEWVWTLAAVVQLSAGVVTAAPTVRVKCDRASGRRDVSSLADCVDTPLHLGSVVLLIDYHWLRLHAP